VERRPGLQQEFFEHLGEIVQQVPAVRDLLGIGSALANPVGVRTGAVARDDLWAGMGDQPLGEPGGEAVREQVHHRPAFEVDEDSAIGVAFTQRPVIDAEHPWGRARGEWGAAEEVQQRGGARGKAQPTYQPCAGFAPERYGEQVEDLGESHGAPRIRDGDVRQPLGEDVPGTGRTTAAELADGEVELHAVLAPRQVGQGAGVEAVNALGQHTAERAGNGRPGGDQGRGDVAGCKRDGLEVEGIGEGEECSGHTSEVRHRSIVAPALPASPKGGESQDVLARFLAQRLRSALTHYAAECGDGESGRNWADIEGLEAVLSRCRTYGAQLVVGYTGGEGTLRERPWVELAGRRYKWDWVAGGVGKKVPRNWIPGHRFSAAITALDRSQCSVLSSLLSYAGHRDTRDNVHSLLNTR
jgi:hypothetical protein